LTEKDTIQSVRFSCLYY
jgi:hypothetical protein